jgi:uncharacterized damage-inducible protein DinB
VAGLVTSGIDLLADAFGRIRDGVGSVLDGLDAEALSRRPVPGANTLGWLVWHLTRVQDDHVADAAGTDQLWTTDGWFERSGLDLDPSATGYGQSADDVDRVGAIDVDLLRGYHRAVAARTLLVLAEWSDEDLDRVVDESWNPPVTLGVRLVSVVEDDLKHLGQAEYVRGLL